MTHESIVVFANSSKRSSGITPQFTINLTRPITQIKSFEIIGVEVPYTFYNIWKGNTGIADIVPDGQTVATTFVNYDSPINARATIHESSTFLTNLAVLLIKIDNQTYSIPYKYDNSRPNSPTYTHIEYSINQTSLACVVSVVNYRLSFTITSPTPFLKIGMYINGSTFDMVRYIGLSADTEVITYTPTTTATITMPSFYQIFDTRNYREILDYIYCMFRIGDDLYWIRPSQVDEIISFTSLKRINFGEWEDNLTPFSINPDKHYLGYVLGFNGSYASYQMAERKIQIPFKQPKYYETAIAVYIDLYTGYAVTAPDGFYTPETLASTLTAQFALIPELATSTVATNSAGIMTVTINTSTPCSTIQLAYNDFYGWEYLAFKMGLKNCFTLSNSRWLATVTGTNISTATYVGSVPFKYRPTHLFIRSETLGLISTNSFSYTDDPTYTIDNIIHKLQIACQPGSVITDNKKYQNKHLVKRGVSPITQIDFSLYDEDGQLVQLNGRSWSIGVKIEF